MNYNHQNGLGSVIAVSDSTGHVTSQYGYGPYGESSTLSGNPYRFTGRRLDPETGLYYYRSRYYSASLGRFMQNDTIGYDGGINLYAYVGNDPVNGVDPSGKYAGFDDAAFVGVGAVVGVGVVGVSDLARSAYNGQWNVSSSGAYASAAITGGATGLGILYAPATGGASVFAAAAGGAALGNIVQQGIDIGYNNFSYGDFSVDVGMSTAFSLVPIPGLSGIPGVTAGRNSLVAIGRSVITKFENGTISNVTTQTAIKGAVGLSIYDLPGTFAGDFAGDAVSAAADYGSWQFGASDGAKK